MKLDEKQAKMKSEKEKGEAGVLVFP